MTLVALFRVRPLVGSELWQSLQRVKTVLLVSFMSEMKSGSSSLPGP